MTKKPKKIKKTKITKRSTYYRWIEGVNANVKVYPCEHEKPDYKAVLALYEKTEEVLKKRDKDVEDLKVKLGECIEQLVLNNKYHEGRTARYAKLYVGYKKRYQELFKLREVYERIDDENPFTEEESEEQLEQKMKKILDDNKLFIDDKKTKKNKNN